MNTKSPGLQRTGSSSHDLSRLLRIKPRRTKMMTKSAMEVDLYRRRLFSIVDSPSCVRNDDGGGGL